MTRLDAIRQRVERAKDSNAPYEAIAALLINAREDIPALLAVVEAAIIAALMPDGDKLAAYTPVLRRAIYPLLREVEG